MGRDPRYHQAGLTTIGMDSQSLSLLMTRICTPKEKIEKDRNSQNYRTEEIPFRVHQTNTPFTLTRPFVPLRNKALKGEGFLKCLK